MTKCSLQKKLQKTCEYGLREGVCTAISAAVCTGKKRKRKRAFFGGGFTTSDNSGRPVDTTTYFDLASLTKPLCTSLYALSLVATGQLNWEEPCLDKLGIVISPTLSHINLRDILHHSSGLPAYFPYFQRFIPTHSKTNTESIIQYIVNEPLLYLTGSKSVYSDLGYILLGHLLEKVGHQTLTTFFNQKICEPLQLTDRLGFLSICPSFANQHAKVAATEDCLWRKKIIQGEVHDEHCWLMGGVAGHSGLFGTAESVLVLCERLLDCWQDTDNHPTFTNEELRYLFEWKKNSSDWALGFDRPTPGKSSCGSYFSPQSIGHLGFTGTSFWIDPLHDVIVVLLTNRVHPSRDNIKIRTFRPLFHNSLMQHILS